jgi:hypothetical protein
MCGRYACSPSLQMRKSRLNIWHMSTWKSQDYTLDHGFLVQRCPDCTGRPGTWALGAPNVRLRGPGWQAAQTGGYNSLRSNRDMSKCLLIYGPYQIGHYAQCTPDKRIITRNTLWFFILILILQINSSNSNFLYFFLSYYKWHLNRKQNFTKEIFRHCVIKIVEIPSRVC